MARVLKALSAASSRSTVSLTHPASRPATPTWKLGGPLRRAALLSLVIIGSRTAVSSEDATGGKPLAVALEVLPGVESKELDVTRLPILPVAVLSTPTFDATQVDPATVRLGCDGVSKRRKGTFRAHERDVDGDGRKDLVLYVTTTTLPREAGIYDLPFRASTRDGRLLSSTASLQVLLPMGTAEAAPPVPASWAPPFPSDSVGFSNLAPITINDSTVPPTIATPYPSTIEISGVGGIIRTLAVHVTFTHQYPDDVDMMLVGPTGANVVLFSDVGGSTPVSMADYSISDTYMSNFPDNGPLPSGLYKPTNYGSFVDVFPPPAPAPSGAKDLSAFRFTNPNGTWSLYVVDDAIGQSGSLPLGWSLAINTEFTFCNPFPVAINHSGVATPYPSTITVPAFGGVFNGMSVFVNGFSHTLPADVDMLLVCPVSDSLNSTIWSDVGGSTDASGVDIVLDELAASGLPASAPLTSGIFKPTDSGPSDPFPAPAPPPSGNSNFTPFQGIAPGGTWKLYVYDDTAVDSGSISGGWCIGFSGVTATCSPDLNPPVASGIPPLTITQTTCQ